MLCAFPVCHIVLCWTVYYYVFLCVCHVVLHGIVKYYVCVLRMPVVLRRIVTYNAYFCFYFCCRYHLHIHLLSCGTINDWFPQAYTMFTWSNPLHPDVFVGVRKLEAEVVRMCCGMFNGDGNTTGSVCFRIKHLMLLHSLVDFL